MGGAQAAGVLATVKRDGIERAGGTWSAKEEAAFKQPTIDMFEQQSHPLMPRRGSGMMGSLIPAIRAKSSINRCMPRCTHRLRIPIRRL